MSIGWPEITLPNLVSYVIGQVTLRMVPCTTIDGRVAALNSALAITRGKWVLLLEPGWASTPTEMRTALDLADR